jgi:hypothetical protein
MIWGEWFGKNGFGKGARWVFEGHAAALGFSLVDAQDTSRGVFETKEEFEMKRHCSPPSLHLFLFKVGDRKYLSATGRFDPLPKNLFSRLPVRVAETCEVCSPAMAPRRRQSATLNVVSSLTNGRNIIMTQADQRAG